MERVPESTLESDRRQRFLYSGGVNLLRVETIRCVVLLGSIDATCADRWNREQCEWILDELARNMTDAVDGFFTGKRYLIHDRDPLYTKDFLSILADVGIKSIKLPPQSPNLNAYAERFVRTIKEGCLEQMIFFGEDSLRNAIREFVTHYHLERNHQGLRNRLIITMEDNAASGTVRRRQRLGGMLSFYYREAA